MNHPCISGEGGKPCGIFVGESKPWGPGNCRLCFLFATSEKHRKAWGGEPINTDISKWPTMARMVAKLRRPEDKGLGDTVARNIKWLKGDTLASWYKKLTGKDCGCSDRQQALNTDYPYSLTAFSPGGPAVILPPKAGVPVVEGAGKYRHLLYHLYPSKLFDEGSVWRWNIDQLKRRLSLFNGRRIMSVVTDENSEGIKEVKEVAGNGFEFIEQPNDPTLREVASFEPLFGTVANEVGPEDAVFYCHGKGVANFTWQDSMIRRWTEVLYESNLDYWPIVARLLKTNAAAGSFKRVGKYWQQHESVIGDWHYSGSFYWIRGDLFQRANWKIIDQFWSGIEPWPSLHIHKDDAGVIFHQFAGHDAGAYLKENWDRSFTPAYELWTTEHTAERLEPLLLSCILVSHNKPKLVREAIESVKAQTTDSWQLVVIDSGSLAEELTKEYEADPRIALIKSPEGARCQGWQINQAMSYAKGDLICYLADDDVYDPGAFTSFLKAAKEHKDQSAWYGTLERTDIRNGATLTLSALKADVVGGVGGEKLKGRADGMQLCHRSTVKCPWPEGETPEARRYADGIFLDSISVPIHPVPERIGWHRFTKESMHDSLTEVQ